MHGNMVFSTHYILGTPQQSGGFLVCSVNTIVSNPLSENVYGDFPLSWGIPVVLDFLVLWGFSRLCQFRSAGRSFVVGSDHLI